MYSAFFLKSWSFLKQWENKGRTKDGHFVKNNNGDRWAPRGHHLVVVCCNEMRSVKDNHVVCNEMRSVKDNHVLCNEMRSVKDNHKAIRA